MKKFLISAVFAVAAAFSFTGCYDAVYQSIRKEVELEDGTMPGFINNIARFSIGDKQYLLTSNGNLYWKDASVQTAKNWYEISGNGLPESTYYSYYDNEFKGVHFSKVAADQNYIYALGYVMEYDEDNSRNVASKFVLYSAPIPTSGIPCFVWTCSSLSSIMDSYKKSLTTDNYSMDLSIHLFCTNSFVNGHRYAYLRIAGGSPYVTNVVNYSWNVYKLNGSDSTVIKSFNYSTSETGGTATSEMASQAEISNDTLSAVYYGNKVHFLNYLNAETNEGTVAAPTAPTYVYYSDGSTNLIYFKVQDDGTAGTANTIAMGTSAPIICIGVVNDALILGSGYNRSAGSSVGSGYGAFHCILDADGVPQVPTDSGTGKNTYFPTNAADVMCEPYYVRMLLCADPSKNEIYADVYSSMDYVSTENNSGTSSSNRCMWAYHPLRGNWNKE